MTGDELSPSERVVLRAYKVMESAENVMELIAHIPTAIAGAKAEGAREALEAIANLFREQYHDLPCVDIGKSEVQAFLDDKAKFPPRICGAGGADPPR